MTALLYLRCDDSGYASGREHFTLAEACDLIEPFQWAVVSRFDSSLVAADTREAVAPFGAPRYAADLAQEIWRPDWYHTACGDAGARGTTCGCDDQRIEVRR